jgi:hypothetical protein
VHGRPPHGGQDPAGPALLISCARVDACSQRAVRTGLIADYMRVMMMLLCPADLNCRIYMVCDRDPIYIIIPI